MMCELYKQGGDMKQFTVLQAVCLSLASIAFGLVLSGAIAQPPQTSSVMGSPTSMFKVESTFNNRLNEILAEVKAANKTLNDYSEQLDAIEENTKQPLVIPDASEETPEEIDKPQQNETSENRTIVRLYTADSSWSCAACEVQKKRLATSPPSFDYEIIYGPSQGKSPTGKYPAWEVIRPDGSTELRGGVQSTVTLESWINGQSVRVQSGRYSITELRQWIKQNYTPSTRLAADVHPRSEVWRHLQDSRHQFSPSQVSGLQQWEALSLHDAHHQNRITPWRTTTKAVREDKIQLHTLGGCVYWVGT